MMGRIARCDPPLRSGVRSQLASVHRHRAGRHDETTASATHVHSDDAQMTVLDLGLTLDRRDKSRTRGLKARTRVALGLPELARVGDRFRHTDRDDVLGRLVASLLGEVTHQITGATALVGNANRRFVVIVRLDPFDLVRREGASHEVNHLRCTGRGLLEDFENWTLSSQLLESFFELARADRLSAAGRAHRSVVGGLQGLTAHLDNVAKGTAGLAAQDVRHRSGVVILGGQPLTPLPSLELSRRHHDGARLRLHVVLVLLLVTRSELFLGELEAHSMGTLGCKLFAVSRDVRDVGGRTAHSPDR